MQTHYIDVIRRLHEVQAVVALAGLDDIGARGHAMPGLGDFAPGPTTPPARVPPWAAAAGGVAVFPAQEMPDRRRPPEADRGWTDPRRDLAGEAATGAAGRGEWFDFTRPEPAGRGDVPAGGGRGDRAAPGGPDADADTLIFHARDEDADAAPDFGLFQIGWRHRDEAGTGPGRLPGLADAGHMLAGDVFDYI